MSGFCSSQGFISWNFKHWARFKEAPERQERHETPSAFTLYMLPSNCATVSDLPVHQQYAPAQILNRVRCPWTWIHQNSDIFSAEQEEFHEAAHSEVKQSFAVKWFWMSLLPSGCLQTFNLPSWLRQAVSPLLLPLIAILPHSIHPLVVLISFPTNVMSVAGPG